MPDALTIALAQIAPVWLDKQPTLKKVTGAILEVATQRAQTESTFDFDMNDGSKIYWHEVIRRVRENNLVVDEQYF